MVRADPFRIVGWTAADAGRWIERSIAHALAHRLSFVMESTLRSPDVALETLGRVRAAGFHVRLCVFAVPRHVSRARCFLRQERMLKAAGSTRVVDRVIHDTAYENNLLFLRRSIARWGCADVLAFDERGAVIAGGEEGPNVLLDRYVAARERPYSEADRSAIRQDLATAQSLMTERLADGGEIEAMLAEFADLA